MQIGLNLSLTLEHGGAGAPTLDMTFTGTGNALDSRITFTRASTATYFDSAGVLQSAAINAPRFDYNPATLAAQGLLIEEQRTNLLTYSEDLTNAAWSTTGGAATVSGNVAVAPDGATTADKIVSTVATSYGVRTPIFTSTAAEYTQSAFCKADGFNYVKFVWSSAQNATDYAVFNLTNGTVTGGVYTSASITPFGNGWYRCSITSTLAAVSTYSNIWMSDGTLSRGSGVAGNGTSGILVWGAQVELGAFATSYIPTTTTALTRSADVASVNTLSPWYNATEGTVVAVGSSANFANFPFFNHIHDGTNNNQIATMYRSTGAGRLEGAVGGVAWTPVNTANTVSAGTTNKLAFAWTASDQAVTLNAGTVATGTNANIPTVTTMHIGGSRTQGDMLNGYIRRITYYPRRLSNAELQAITA